MLGPRALAAVSAMFPIVFFFISPVIGASGAAAAPVISFVAAIIFMTVHMRYKKIPARRIANCCVTSVSTPGCCGWCDRRSWAGSLKKIQSAAVQTVSCGMSSADDIAQVHKPSEFS